MGNQNLASTASESESTTLEPTIEAESTGQARSAPARLVSMDAFRGLWIVLMVSSGLRIHGTVERLWTAPEWQHLRTPTWQWLAHHTDHAEWSGCTFWDLIQPSFMFTVGCALAFSIASRKARGHSFWRMLGHAIFRSLALIFLSIFLISSGRQTTWQFTNVLVGTSGRMCTTFSASPTRPWPRRACSWSSAGLCAGGCTDARFSLESELLSHLADSATDPVVFRPGTLGGME